jgi:hypothetical protein
MEYYSLDQLKNAKIKRVDLGNKIFDEIDNKMRESYYDCCILYIDEIYNDELNEKYEKCKQGLIEKRGEKEIKELTLFHGTKHSSILGITEGGFKVSLNRVNAYGIGTYLSPNAKMATGYTNVTKGDDTYLDGVEVSYLFYCKVLVGKKTVGKAGALLNTNEFDVGVNNVKNPTIYSIPYDDAIVPLYLVAFYKNAQ